MVRVWESKSVRHAVSNISKERGDLRWRDQLRILVLDYHERISIVKFHKQTWYEAFYFILFFFLHI